MFLLLVDLFHSFLHPSSHPVPIPFDVKDYKSWRLNGFPLAATTHTLPADVVKLAELGISYTWFILTGFTIICVYNLYTYI